MNKKLVCLIFIITLMSVFSSAYTTSDFSTNQFVFIDNAGGAKSNYNFKYTLDTETLITNGNIRSDCGDIRILNAAGTAEQPYVLSNCNDDQTRIIFKANFSSGSNQFFLSYGNATITNGSNPDAVYVEYDDFESDLGWEKSQFLPYYDIPAYTDGEGHFVGSGNIETGSNCCGDRTENGVQGIDGGDVLFVWANRAQHYTVNRTLSVSGGDYYIGFDYTTRHEESYSDRNSLEAYWFADVGSHSFSSLLSTPYPDYRPYRWVGKKPPVYVDHSEYVWNHKEKALSSPNVLFSVWHSGVYEINAARLIIDNLYVVQYSSDLTLGDIPLLNTIELNSYGDTIGFNESITFDYHDVTASSCSLTINAESPVSMTKVGIKFTTTISDAFYNLVNNTVSVSCTGGQPDVIYSIIEDPTVYSCTQLQNMLVANKNINLANDIDCSGGFASTWHYGSGGSFENNAYTKTLEGNDYKITNGAFAATSKTGLIPKIAGGKVQNLVLQNFAITGTPLTSSYIGAVSGHAIGELYDITVNGSSGIIGGGSYIGGLAGFFQGTANNLNYDAAMVNGSVEFIGGIFGQTGSGSLKVLQSDALVRGNNAVGGLIGENKANLESSKFAGQVDNLGVSGNPTFIGGLVGSQKGGHIIESSSVGILNITGTYLFGMGSIAGNLYNSKIEDSYSTATLVDNSIANDQYIGGIAGVMEKSTIKNSYTTSNPFFAKNNLDGGITGWADVDSSILTSYFLDVGTNRQYGNPNLPGIGPFSGSQISDANLKNMLIYQPAWDYVTKWYATAGSYPVTLGGQSIFLPQSFSKVSPVIDFQVEGDTKNLVMPVGSSINIYALHLFPTTNNQDYKEEIEYHTIKIKDPNNRVIRTIKSNFTSDAFVLDYLGNYTVTITYAGSTYVDNYSDEVIITSEYPFILPLADVEVDNCGDLLGAFIKNVNVNLTQDIDCTNTTVPGRWHGEINGIFGFHYHGGPQIHYYSKVFDGKGFKIKNFTLITNKDRTGLIPVVRGGTVKNLIFEGGYVNTSGSHRGDYAGMLSGEFKGNIENVTVDGAVVQANTNAGGLFGLFHAGVAENLTVQNSIIIGADDKWVHPGTGAVFGILQGTATNIQSINNTVSNIASANKPELYIGGIAGLMYRGELYNSTVTDGLISGTDYVGGAVGYLSQGSTIVNVTTNTTVQSSTEYVGGVVGRMQSGTVTQVKSDSTTKGAQYAGGIVGLLDGAKLSECLHIGSIRPIAGSGAFFGGIVGKISSSTSTLTDCEANGTFVGTSGVSYMGGIAGHSVSGILKDNLVMIDPFVGSSNEGYFAGLGAATWNSNYALEVGSETAIFGTNAGASTTTTEKRSAANLQILYSTQDPGSEWDWNRTWAQPVGEFPRLYVFNPGLTPSLSKLTPTFSYSVNGTTIDQEKTLGDNITWSAITTFPSASGTFKNNLRFEIFDPFEERIVTVNSNQTTGSIILNKTGNYTFRITYIGTSKFEEVVEEVIITSNWPFVVPAGNPVQISDCETLRRTLLVGKDGNLTSDIDCTGVTWQNWSASQLGWEVYVGTFTGNYYKIHGLTINGSGQDYVGLVPQVGYGSSGNNVFFDNFTVYGRNYVGAFLGSTVGSVNVDPKEAFFAEFVSINNTNVYGNDSVGLLAGNVNGYGINLYADGYVEGRETIGGLFGSVSHTAMLVDAEVNTIVNGTNKVGGIAGFMYGGNVNRALFKGNLHQSEGNWADRYVGGLVGFSDYRFDRSSFWRLRNNYFATSSFFSNDTAVNYVGDLPTVGDIEKIIVDSMRNLLMGKISDPVIKYYNGIPSTNFTKKEPFMEDGFEFPGIWGINDTFEAPYLCQFTRVYSGGEATTGTRCESNAPDWGLQSLNGAVVDRAAFAAASTGFSSFNMSIGDDFNGNIQDYYFDVQTVRIRNGSDLLIEFDHDFNSDSLVLTDAYVNLTGTDMVISGIDSNEFYTKSIYVPFISDNFCVKDAAVTSSADISKDCSESDEFLFTQELCQAGFPPKFGSPVICRTDTDNPGEYIIVNLEHTAIEGSTAKLDFTHVVDGTQSANDNVSFSSNYVDKFSNELLTGASCNVTLPNATVLVMSEGSTKYNFTLVGGFSSDGIYEVNSTCAKSGYDTLTATEYVYVGSVADVDFDGVADASDNLVGDSDDVTVTGFTTKTVVISGDQDANIQKTYVGLRPIQILDAGSTVIQFDFNFSEQKLNLSKFSIQKSGNKVLVKDLNLSAGETKTVYGYFTTSSICVKNDEVTSITDITATCTGTNEHEFLQSDCSGGGTSTTINGDTVTCKYNNGIYNISGLSYSLISGTNATLETSDSGDTTTNNAVSFFGNYTDNSDDSHIDGASCTIEFNSNGTQYNMVDSVADYNYTLTSGFSSAGAQTYNITCAKTGFETLSTTDSVTITSSVPIPEFSTIAMIVAILGTIVISGYVRRKELE